MGSQKKDSHLPDYAMVERQEMLRGVGYSDEAIERPQIGVVSSWGEVNPASIHLDRVTAAVKAGVWAAGGTPREFVISSICTSMAGNDRYHLPHRDLVAGYIETVAETNLFDGLVCVPICDDVIPAHLMAAARLNLPSVFVTGGYMQLNRHKGEVLEPLDIAPVHFADFKANKISPAEFCRIKDRGCMGTGACPVMGTANTMAAMAEALGMTFPGNTTVPGADSHLLRMAFKAGQQVVYLHSQNIKPSNIMTEAAFRNAIRLLMAIGGSTNAVLHLQAIASELELEIEPQTFNELSRTTPFICDALNENAISAGEVVIVRYVGPKGDPGMRLLQRFLWQLAAKGMQNKIAFITDGRFSGTNKGCEVAHIAPEAIDGSPLAVVRDGDMIEIDIPNHKLWLDIGDEELKNRMDVWQPPPSKVKKGYLAIYAKMAKPADKGAALRYDED